MSEMPVIGWTRQMKLEAVIKSAARRLPAQAGEMLLGLLEPTALATMLGVLTIWAGAHFFGAGEMADIVLIALGWVALGGVAIEAGKELYSFATGTLSAQNAQDIEAAGQHLAAAISLVGVQTVMALLTHGPKTTFKTPYRGRNLAPYSRKLPQQPGVFYKPKITFTKDKLAGRGTTAATGDTTIGRDHYGGQLDIVAKEIRLAAYHEAVHRFLTPKLQIFRDVRVYMKQSGYSKSYILRYLEEALAETYGQLRAYGMGKEQFIKGVKFPLGAQYEISVVQLGEEARGILIGPITVGGMIYNVYQGARTEDYEPAR